MRMLSNLDFLQLWERGSVLHPLDRALLTLSTALPQEPYGTLADWPLGQRNAALADVRRACFGTKMQAWVACPQCGERLEFEMDVDALNEEPGQAQVDFRGRNFRLPTSRDLAQVVKEQDSRDAALQLAQRCCLGDLKLDALSEEDLDHLGDCLAQADPMAETRLNLSCARCGAHWYESLDLADWLWSEIDTRARRLLLEVHTLASAYGWSEAEVLSLSEPRRAAYLEMVQS
jgi:hypothetical protein